MSGHRLSMTFTYEDGLTYRHTTFSGISAAEAQRIRVARLREMGISFRSGPGWLEYRDEPPRHVRLEWADMPEAAT